jgi:hypothetical protein
MMPVMGTAPSPREHKARLIQELVMAIEIHSSCELCGVTQHDRPLVKTAFRGIALHICIQCMPKACQGLDWADLGEKVREKRSKALNETPLAKPGLRY